MLSFTATGTPQSDRSLLPDSVSALASASASASSRKEMKTAGSPCSRMHRVTASDRGLRAHRAGAMHRHNGGYRAALGGQICWLVHGKNPSDDRLMPLDADAEHLIRVALPPSAAGENFHLAMAATTRRLDRHPDGPPINHSVPHH